MRCTKFKPSLVVTGVSAAILLAAGLTACSDSASDIKFTAWPAGFEGCTMAKLEPASGQNVTAVRCPNSATTTTWQDGKRGPASATVIDGNLPKQSAPSPALQAQSNPYAPPRAVRQLIDGGRHD